MENDIKQEIKQEDNLNQVEITAEDIYENDSDNGLEDDEKYEINIELIENYSSKINQNLSESLENDVNDNYSTEIKPEPLDEEEYEGNLHQNTNNNTWTPIKKEIEEFNDENNSSDYFIEQCIKTENDTGDFLNEDVKEYDIDEEHCYDTKTEYLELEDNFVKSETNDQRKKPIFECNLCDYKSHNQNSLKAHSNFHQDPSTLVWFYCTKCNYKTRQKAHLKRHDFTHKQPSEIQRFICYICSSDFKYKNTLKRHIETVHLNHTKSSPQGTDAPSFKCKKCDYTTSKKGLLTSHLDKHKDVSKVTNLYICDTCSFLTKYRRNLRVHLETHKDQQNLQLFECKVCKYKTRLGYCLRRHFRSKKHLEVVGKLEEYCPRSMKMKKEH